MYPRCMTFSPLIFDPPRFDTPHEPSTEAMATAPAPILASDSVFTPAVPPRDLAIATIAERLADHTAAATAATEPRVRVES